MKKTENAGMSPVSAEGVDMATRTDVRRAVFEFGTPLRIFDLGRAAAIVDRLLKENRNSTVCLSYEQSIHPSFYQLLQLEGVRFLAHSPEDERKFAENFVDSSCVIRLFEEMGQRAKRTVEESWAEFSPAVLEVSSPDKGADPMDRSLYESTAELVKFNGSAAVVIDSRWDESVELGPDQFGGYGVFARRDVRKGEFVYALTGHLARQRTFSSVQVGASLHLEPAVLGAHTNHSCEPNAGILDNDSGTYDVFALVDIAAGEEVTVDYGTFESAITSEFLANCKCGAAACRGNVTGFAGLPEEKRQVYGRYIARHLLDGGIDVTESGNSPHDAYQQRARSGPRLTKMFATFSAFADGTKGQPTRAVVSGDPDLIQHDALVGEMLDEYARRAGKFNAHALASIPYAMEEDSRIGAAILQYQRQYGIRDESMKVWSLGAAEGVMPRALAHLAKGEIDTFSCSPNPENELEFHRNGAPRESSFFVGPFLDVPTAIRSDLDYRRFRQGFDVVYEDTTFQMYGPERVEPIALVKEVLKPGGVLVLLEKMSNADEEEYWRREKQKDSDFKARYFDESEIATKRKTILEDMENGEVQEADLSAALRRHFAHAAVTWNSGNFYTYVASDDRTAIERFVGCMIEPAVPPEYNNEQLPKALFGTENLSFRTAKP